MSLFDETLVKHLATTTTISDTLKVNLAVVSDSQSLSKLGV
jgi:hypothetical protein